MTKLSIATLSAAQLDDKVLYTVAGGGVFDRKSVKYGPQNTVRAGNITGDGNIVSGRDTNVYG